MLGGGFSGGLGSSCSTRRNSGDSRARLGLIPQVISTPSPKPGERHRRQREEGIEVGRRRSTGGLIPAGSGRDISG